jgi:predicted metal-dependent peptidase
VEPNLTLLVGDAAVHQVVPARDLGAFLGGLPLKGGGGTDHRPVFAWIKQARRRPDVFIGLTDLHSAFPEKAPPYQVVWITTPDHGPAPWGRVVELEEWG